MDVPYFSRSVVAYEGDSYSLVESFVVHIPLVDLAGPLKGPCLVLVIE
jgi:hypothetical protein